MEAGELEVAIEELGERVERLRALYDQYFMGIEKIEPLIYRKDVDRRLWVLRREQVRNAVLRFKLQTVNSRYNTYQQYWARICRQIEDGTYTRDVNRATARFGDVATTTLARKRQKMFEKGAVRKAEREAWRAGLDPNAAAAAPAPVAPQVPQVPASRDVRFDDLGPLALDLDHLDLHDAPAPPGAAAPAPRAPARVVEPASAGAPPPPPARPSLRRSPFAEAPRPAAPTPSATSSDLSDARMRQIYGEYVDAKRKCNESTAAITYDAVAKSLRSSVATLQQKHGSARIDFEVVVKNGKPSLRPVVKG